MKEKATIEGGEDVLEAHDYFDIIDSKNFAAAMSSPLKNSTFNPPTATTGAGMDEQATDASDPTTPLGTNGDQ